MKNLCRMKDEMLMKSPNSASDMNNKKVLCDPFIDKIYLTQSLKSNIFFIMLIYLQKIFSFFLNLQLSSKGYLLMLL